MKKRANISYRIPPDFWRKPDKLSELLALLDQNREGFDDIALFVAGGHSVRALSVVAAEMPRLKTVIAALKSKGIRTGINLLSLVGHHTEDIPEIPQDVQPLTGMDGRGCPGTACPRVPSNRDYYMIPLLKMLAETEPDFIWLDDDLRFWGHGNVLLACFCDHCLAEFNQLWSADFTRETLRAAFDTGSADERLLWRERWLAFSGEGLKQLLSMAEKTVHEVDRRIEMGAMDAGMRIGDSAGMDELAKALAGNGDTPIRWRPGAGAYSDTWGVDAFFAKAQVLGTESACLPDWVDNIQAEVENFNYQRLSKSQKATALEGTLYLASGLTGCAWNVLDSEDALETFVPLVQSLTGIRPFLDLQAQWARVRPVGIYHGWSQRNSAGAGIAADAAWESTINNWRNPHCSGLFSMGLPPAFRLQDAAVTILTEQCARTLGDKELTEIFKRGVFCLAEALPTLEERGFGHLLGFRIVKRFEADAIERLCAHPLNEGYAGFCRDCRQSFPWAHESAFCFENLDGRGETLAELVNYQRETTGACSLGIYQNEFGGRVAVSGYYPLTDLHFKSKAITMKRLFNWLAKGDLAAYVSSYHRICQWSRVLDDGTTVVQLANLSADPAREVTLTLAQGGLRADFYDWSLARQNLVGKQDKAGGTSFVLPEIPMWESAIVVGSCK